jgi:nicotinate-nucleotide pyrophosphorylase (carboxylating)
MLSPATHALIDLALQEDLAFGDLTAEAIFPPEHRSTARLLAKQELVASGLEVASAVLARVDPSAVLSGGAPEGARIPKAGLLGRLEGTTIGLLKAERTLLNFLQRLCGIATSSARHAAAAGGSGIRIVDTRKTTPGWRALEKAAVRAGGCHNHRWSLGEHVLIKDNHIAAAGSVRRSIELCRSRAPHLARIECEVTDLAMLREALEAGADVVLLDNMSPAQVAEAVRITAGRAVLEISGGVTLDSLPEYARTGADVVSVGALTHGARSVDISLEFDPARTVRRRRAAR